MTAPAVITGSLVNMRNVGTHKSVALTVHVPEELAQQVIAAFGWPTAATPVAVALARLNPNAKLDAQPEAGPKERRRFQDLPPAQQAAMRCNEPAFQQYMFERFGVAKDEPSAAAQVRLWCNVGSRAQIKVGTNSGDLWTSLNDRFIAWKTVDA